MATPRSSDRETYDEATAASSSGMIEGALKVLECRSMADKGDCMHFCMCKISIVRTSYESLQEEMIDYVRFVAAPTYRHKLKLTKRNVWKQSKSKECSIHWAKHNAGNFDLNFHHSGRLHWAESKQASSAMDDSLMSEEELLWNSIASNRPRFKFEIFALGSPSAPKEKFLGQAYLSWDEIAAKLQSPTNHPDSKIFLALKPRNLKSRAKGYIVLSCFRRDQEILQQADLRFAKTNAKARMVTDLRLGEAFILRNLATYMKRMVLYCRVGKVENLPASSSISHLADPYVLLQTHPQASEFSRSARTTTKFQTLTTTFMEAFLFESLRPEVQDLLVSVWDENTGAQHTCLGYVVIPFELVWHNMLVKNKNAAAAKKDSDDVLEKIEEHTMGFELQNAKGKTVLGRNSSPSTVHLSAWFGNFRETSAACKYSQRGIPGNVGDAVFFEPELRTLHIDILKAKNVPPKILKNGSVAGRNCYCTVSMTGCFQKNSTQVQKATLWPEFNEKFALIVAQNQMHRARLQDEDPQAAVADEEEAKGEEESDERPTTTTRYGEGSASHRSFDIGFNDKVLLDIAKKAERESPILTIKMFDYDPINQSLAGDKCLGKVKVPVSNLPTLSGTAAEQNWIPLQCAKRKSMKYTKAAPELCVRACFRSEDRVPLASRKSIGRVSITLKKVYLEGSVAQLASDRGGLYCLVKYGREMVRTPCRQMKKARNQLGSCLQSQTKRLMMDDSSSSSRSGYNEYQSLNSMRSSRSQQQGTGRSESDDIYRSEDGLSVDELQTFQLGDRLMFPILEPASVVTMGIFDRGDTRLSKIQMKLSTFLQRSNKMLYPISIDLQGKEGKSEMRHVGYLEFSLKLDYESKLDLWQRYFALAQPPLHYTDPLPLKIRYNIQLQTHDLLKRSLLQGSTKLPSTVAKDILGTDDLKFSIKNLQSRFASITDSLRSLVPVDLTKIKLYDPLSWDKPFLSLLIVFAYCVLIQYAEFLMPLVFLLLVVAGLSLRKFQREIILYELSRLSHKDDDKDKDKNKKGSSDLGLGPSAGYKQALKEAVKMDSTVVVGQGQEEEQHQSDWTEYEGEKDDEEYESYDKEAKEEAEDFSISNLGIDCEDNDNAIRGGGEKERVLKVKRKVEIVKLEVRDKLLTVKTKVEGKIEVFKMKVGGSVEDINRALRKKFPNLKLKLQDLKQQHKAFRKNVKKGVKKRANKVKTKVGEVLQKAGGAIDGVRGLARKEIESKLLAVRKRASLVIVMDKYIQLKRQYEELKAFSGIFQMLLGELNKGLQNVRGLVLWTDPRISFFFVFGCFLFSLFLFWFGMKATLQLSGLYLFRPPCLRDPFPPLAFNPFMRLSSVEESPLWCYIGMRKSSSSSSSSDAEKKTA